MTSNSEHKFQADIDAYLENLMTESERTLFETQMENDPSLKEEVLLQRSVYEGIFKNKWDVIENNRLCSRQLTHFESG